MANECENLLTITGKLAQRQAFKKKAQGEDTPLSIARLYNMHEDEDAYIWCMYHFNLPDDLESELDEGDDKLAYWFWTADVPPEKWLQQVSVLFPQLRFSNKYHDPNNGQGVIHAQNGELIEYVDTVVEDQ